MKRQAGSPFIVKFFRDFRDDDRSKHTRVSVRLDHDGGPFLAALAGRVRKPDQDHVTAGHGLPGR